MKKVLLIYGGTSTEHDVSCMSANSIIKNIDRNKYKLDCLKITKDNKWICNNEEVFNIVTFLKKYDVIFPITHGSNGEDGKLQGLLDLFNIRYVGSNWGSSYVCMDKSRTKEILSYYQIPQVPFQIYEKGRLNDKLNITFPVIIKPANGGSSIGIKIAKNKQQFKKAIKFAYKYDKKIIIEKYIQAQELECAVLENKKIIISEIGEINPANNFYDYEAKYINKKSKTIIPANINKNTKKEIEKYAKKVFKLLNLKGLARIDFFFDINQKKLYLNEINTLPGFTEISMFPKLIMNEGISYKKILSILIDNA